MSVEALHLPPVRGRYTENAPLGDTSWFKCGGAAQVLYKPADQNDLGTFLMGCPSDVPVMVLGVCSNVIIRDGGIKGVVIKLGGAFAQIEVDANAGILRAGAAALDMNVALAAAREGMAGLEFLSGIPGSIGGALRMNAGAYGRESVDGLIEAVAFDRSGGLHTLSPAQMDMRYRHCGVPDDYIFTSARFEVQADDKAEIESRMAAIREKRNISQPVRSRTGGSTFANPTVEEIRAHDLPEGIKAWQMIESVGGRGLKKGGAQMSELHCNFMINTGDACAADLEGLGEDIRARVKDKYGYQLRWEIKRIGELKDALAVPVGSA